jgi:hypothetical protein
VGIPSPQGAMLTQGSTLIFQVGNCGTRTFRAGDKLGCTALGAQHAQVLSSTPRTGQKKTFCTGKYQSPSLRTRQRCLSLASS